MRVIAQGNDPSQITEVRKGEQVRLYFERDLTLMEVGELMPVLGDVRYGSRVLITDMAPTGTVGEVIGWQIVAENGMGTMGLGLVVLGVGAGLMIVLAGRRK